MNEIATAPRKIAALDTAPIEAEQSSLLAVISKAARDPSVDVDKFERLAAMLERMEQQKARKAFNAAVSVAKGEIGQINKNREVDFTSPKGRTHYRYEDFAGIARGVDPVLSKYGLGYRFSSAQTGQKLKITCILFHSDGWEEQTSLEASNDTSGNKNDHQSVGSAATYLQRYTLKIALGLAASNDADGRSASANTDNGEVLLSDDQIRDIIARMENAKLRYEQVCRHFKVKKLNELNAADYNEVIRVIDETAAYRAKMAVKECAKK